MRGRPPRPRTPFPLVPDAFAARQPLRQGEPGSPPDRLVFGARMRQERSHTPLALGKSIGKNDDVQSR